MSAVPGEGAAVACARWTRATAAMVRFVTAPASPLPLGILRLGLGALILCQGLAVLPHLEEMYGSLGLVQSPVVDALVRPWTPRLSWITAALAPLGCGEDGAIRAVFALHLASATAFTLGWRTRISAVSVWLTHLVLGTSACAHSYGVDTFLKIALFYCMFARVGASLSLDAAAGRTSPAPSWTTRLVLRVLQVHLSVVYCATGIEKACGAQWWNGEALWRSWMRPDLGAIDFSWVAWCPWLAVLGCWTTLGLEIGYGLFVWPRATRAWCAYAILAMHGAIAVTLGLWAFAWIMMLLTFCAWLVPCEPPPRDACRGAGTDPLPGAAPMAVPPRRALASAPGRAVTRQVLPGIMRVQPISNGVTSLCAPLPPCFPGSFPSSPQPSRPRP